MESIGRAAAEQLKLKQSISQLVNNVKHDHNYQKCVITAGTYKVKGEQAPQYLVRALYEEHVCVGPTEAAELEMTTRNQSQSNRWHEERKLRITASIMKTVCSRKPTTDNKKFIESKLAPKAINSAAI